MPQQNPVWFQLLSNSKPLRFCKEMESRKKIGRERGGKGERKREKNMN
jgi:hypothetical protein